MSEILRAPFPWFGGKGREEVRCAVWNAFGADLPNYTEPFYATGAVLLGRPGGAGKIETANDINSFVMNLWRAICFAPDDVARWCDWPVSEADMHARHGWLVERLPEHRERMQRDPDYFDPKIAGWWVYGQCLWIGSGWCAEPKNRKIPKLDGIGKGINSDRAHPPRWPVHLSSENGVHRLPSIGNDRGINALGAPPAAAWFRALQERLRRVRFVCGDFERVLSASALGKGKNVGGRRPCGVFLDPPYPLDSRSARLYSDDDAKVWFRARDWALEHGADPDLRIALCGYDGDFAPPDGWQTYAWEPPRGYAGDGNNNRERERIWFSPHCLAAETQGQLFGVQNLAGPDPAQSHSIGMKQELDQAEGG